MELRKFVVSRVRFPFRVNGSSVGRVHNIMARPIKSAVQIRSKKAFIPISAHSALGKVRNGNAGWFDA